MLMIKSYMRNSNNNNNNNININNNINNTNINLIGFNKEDILEVLTNKEKRKVINSGYCCLDELIKITNCSNYNQFKNIIITNLKDNYAFIYDEKEGFFKTTTKNEALNDLIESRTSDIHMISTELLESPKVSELMKQKVKEFLDKMNDKDTQLIDYTENKTYKTYKDCKINDIVFLLYNNNEKLTKNISNILLNNKE